MMTEAPKKPSGSSKLEISLSADANEVSEEALGKLFEGLKKNGGKSAATKVGEDLVWGVRHAVKIWKAATGAIKKFNNAEARAVVMKAKATRIERLVDGELAEKNANAEVKHAKADELRSKGRILNAKARSIELNNQLLEEALRQVRERRIDLALDYNDGEPRAIIRKLPPPSKKDHQDGSAESAKDKADE